jgi:chromosome partitioning protein
MPTTVGREGDASAPKWPLLGPAGPRPPGARMVCIANQKGGVGKTTTSINVGAALALRGHRVLLIDIDPQANATTGLGIDHRTLSRSTYDLVSHTATIEDIVRPTAIAGLDCAPATRDLAGAEVELVKQMARERRLRQMLGPARARYEVVLLDCPPSLGLLTVNALIAAEDLIVPVQCEYYALEGLGGLLGTAERVRRSLNPGLRIAGFVLTMFDARTKLSGQVAQEVRSHFGRLVFKAVIPRSVRLSEAPSFGEPVVTLDPGSRASISYRLLANEVAERFRLATSDASTPAPPDLEPTRTPAPPDLEPTRTPAPQAPPPTPGPRGRGYGTVSPEPPGLDHAWPRTQPWTASR